MKSKGKKPGEEEAFAAWKPRNKAARLQIQNQPAGWKAIFNSIPDLFSIHDADFQIVLANTALASAVGVAPEALTGRKCHEVYHGKSEPIPECPHMRLLKTREPCTGEFWEPHLGAFFQFSCSPVLNRKTELVASVNIAKNITERKQAEDDLRESEARFRGLTENITDWIWQVDDQLRYVYSSPQVLHLLGYEPAEVLGKAPWDFMPPAEVSRLKSKLDALRAAPQPFRAIENIHLHKDGSVRVLETSGIPARDREGRFRGFHGIDRDITGRKRIEEELRASRNELERRVEERTAKAQESESRLRVLAAELMKAQETERLRIAHDLHDSLAAQLVAIKYKMERMLNKAADPAAHPVPLEEIIADIQMANVEIRRIIANLRPSILDDLGLVAAVSWFSRETEKAYPGTVVAFSAGMDEQELPEDLKIVLFRVIQESVTNAVRHGQAGRIAVELEKNKNWLQLKIEDNGHGFEPGKRGESSGSGLGLLSMQQRVDSSQGIFSISSMVGHGTVVKAAWRMP